ncbi:hypothetical protein QP027_06450 [Corynebacterium breve]|uniref:DUF975 family protein n=1 Tax=Corynebacterium breve TaxID=3049799 RepID=A0ABY8VBT2_9CORY|nr:hypothetical protein [Corynebacterium breve]WIM66777.1 hypothetical protein QP027_06450 [Corynebacterium breve]
MTTPPNDNNNSGYPNFPGEGSNPFDGSQSPQQPHQPAGGFPEYPATPHPEDTQGFGQQNQQNQQYQQYQQPTSGYGAYPDSPSGYAVQAESQPPMVNTDGRIHVMRALKWGFSVTFSNAFVWILGAIASGIVIMVVAGGGGMLFGATGSMFATAVWDIIVSLATSALMVFVLRGMIWQVDKHKASYSDLTKDVHFVPAFIVSIIITAISSGVGYAFGWGMGGSLMNDLGTEPTPEQLTSAMGPMIGVVALAGIVSLLIGPFIMFPIHFAVEGRAKGIGQAFAMAFDAGKRNYGKLILYSVVVALAATLVIVLTLGLATVIIAPAMMLTTVHMYRQAAGGPIPQNPQYDAPANPGYQGFA